jgi:hypothetical protein
MSLVPRMIRDMNQADQVDKTQAQLIWPSGSHPTAPGLGPPPAEIPAVAELEPPSRVSRDKERLSYRT